MHNPVHPGDGRTPARSKGRLTRPLVSWLTTRSSRLAALAGAVGLGTGCSALRPDPIPTYPQAGLNQVQTAAAGRPPAANSVSPLASRPTSGVQQAQATLPSTNTPTATPTPTAPAAATDVDSLVQSAFAANPRLGRANALVDAARWRIVQAGLKPNPVFSFTADELGDRTGPMGILGPQISQEIVLGGKLTLGQAVAAREADQATLAVLNERYALAAAVRSAAYDLAALRQRLDVLNEVVGIAEKSAEQALKAEKNPNGVFTRGDVLPLELDLERFKAERRAVEREIPGAERRLAAVVGDARVTVGPLALDLTAPLPAYDLDQAKETVMATHPEAVSAGVAVERAKAAVARAEAELVPNVTVSAGYTRQNQNRSSDWGLGVSVPLIIRNRNQGNIRAARADVVAATLDVTRVQNNLAERVATAYRAYAAARERAELYKSTVIPKAEEAVRFLELQREKGVVEPLKVFVAQRTVVEAKLEYNRALGEAWRSAAELSGLLLEETWPNAGTVKPLPPGPPMPPPNPR